MKDLLSRCVEVGLKMTDQRRVILRTLEKSSDHPSVDEVYLRAKEQDPSISIATVYRTLSMLDEMGFIVRHDFNENFSRYEVNNLGNHHHHLIDLETGDVIEFKNAELEKIKLRIAKELGYDLLDHRLELYGRKIRE